MQTRNRQKAGQQVAPGPIRSVKRRSLSRDLGSPIVRRSGRPKSSDSVFAKSASDEEQYLAEQDEEMEEKGAPFAELEDSQSNEGDYSDEDEEEEEEAPVPGEGNIQEMLSNIGRLNLEADNVIANFLQVFRTQKDYINLMRKDKSHITKSFKNRLADFNKVLKYYTEGRVVKSENVEEHLQLSNAFDQIFQKANLAAITGHISIPPNEIDLGDSYMKNGGWINEFINNSGCTNMDPEETYRFVTAWRTQLYIMGIASIPKDNDTTTWPDKCLYGLFVLNMDLSQLAFADPTSSFDSKLQNADMIGWESQSLPAPQKYEDALKAHVRKLRDYTSINDNSLTVDIDALRADYPYQVFLEQFYNWLKKAVTKIKETKPSVSRIVDIARENMGEVDVIREELQALMANTLTEPDVHYPELLLPQGNRRHTYGFEERTRDVGLSAVKPRPSIKQSASRDLRNTLKKLSEIKKNSVSKSGLKPPRNAQPKADISFDFNKALLDSTVNEDKENMSSVLGPAQRGIFNQRQANATKVSFDDTELEGSQVYTGGENTELTVPDDGPAHPVDEDIVPSSSKKKKQMPAINPTTKHTQQKRKLQDIIDSDDEEDDYEPLPPASAKRSPKKARYPAISSNNRIRNSEAQAKAAYPRAQSPVAPTRQSPAHRAPRESPDDSEEEHSVPEVDVTARAPARSRGRIRRDWPEEDIEVLITAIREVSTKWSIIRDQYFAKRWTDVDCKDKARNLKITYLKNLEKLPRNFDKVTLGATYINSLERQGIGYKNGERRGYRIA